jgi:site-specific DNA-cytosine methylase
MNDFVSVENEPKRRKISLKVLEFFSGLGGWSSALKKLSVDHEVIQAFDINTAANEVYEANHGIKPSNKSILGVTQKSLDKCNADVWVLSPPCQPFTRNNETVSRDAKDSRSEPFLHLLEVLKQMTNLPKYIALENVVGFESSDCCKTYFETLHSRSYQFQQFHLDPLQFGIPNSRPRYYCIAKRISNDEMNSEKLNETEFPVPPLETELTVVKGGDLPRLPLSAYLNPFTPSITTVRDHNYFLLLFCYIFLLAIFFTTDLRIIRRNPSEQIRLVFGHSNCSELLFILLYEIL